MFTIVVAKFLLSLDGADNTGYSPPQVTMSSPHTVRTPIAGRARRFPVRLLVAIVLASSLSDRGSLPLSGDSPWLPWNRAASPNKRSDAGIDSLDGSIAWNLRHSRLIDAIGIATHQLDLRLARFGRGSPEAALSYRALATIYHECGIYSRADQLARLALAVQRQQHCDPVEIARSLTELGRTLKDRVRFDEAHAAYAVALSTLIRSRAPGDIEFAPVLEGVGHLARRERRGEEAERLLRRALAIRRHVDHGSLELAEQETWFGWFLDQNGKPAEAETHLLEALRILEAAPVQQGELARRNDGGARGDGARS